MVDKDPRSIRSMFAGIAPRYDAANRLLSMRLDVAWRRRVARLLLTSPGRVLDLAAGTGDLTVDLARHGSHEVVSGDFTFEMLAAGRHKVRSCASVRQVAADALALPFADGSFDAVSIAFGIRNFVDPSAALAEIRRIVRPGGVVGILEFSRPHPLLDIFYRIYSRHMIPLIGGLVTGSRQPYEYLPASVREFPEGRAFLELMSASGWNGLEARRMSGGIVTFYRGENHGS